MSMENIAGKNRPVATNFQFLKIFCPSGTALLQRSRVFEVLLLGCACPKPCWNEYGKLEFIFFFLNIGILLICIAGTHFRMLLSKNLPLH